MVVSELTSVQPAPTETCPGRDVASPPPRAGSWQVAHDTATGGPPTGWRAGGESRPMASFCVAPPENPVSTYSLCPRAIAPAWFQYAFDRSASGGGGLASDATRLHSASDHSQRESPQNQSSAMSPQPATSRTSSS